MLYSLGRYPSVSRRELAKKVFSHTARYDSLIANYLNEQLAETPEQKFPPLLSVIFEKKEDLRYGENPHQAGAVYLDGQAKEASVCQGKQLHGKAMSYNNYLDANAALEVVKEFEELAVVIVKHNNPCGVALGDTPCEAYVRARETDPISAFGGVIACNREVDQVLAKEITSTFVEVLIAPRFSEDALAELQRKKDLRLLAVGELEHPHPNQLDMRKIVGGILVQERDLGSLRDLSDLQIPSQRQPTNLEYQACDFAWKVLQACEIQCHRVCYWHPNCGYRCWTNESSGFGGNWHK